MSAVAADTAVAVAVAADTAVVVAVAADTAVAVAVAADMYFVVVVDIVSVVKVEQSLRVVPVALD